MVEEIKLIDELLNELQKQMSKKAFLEFLAELLLNINKRIENVKQ